MIQDLLPIGTIVLLKEGKKKLMIFGVKQSDTDGKEGQVEYDYVGVLYPEGNLGSEYQFLFNHDNIDQVYFRGFEDEEREEFIKKLSEAYGE